MRDRGRARIDANGGLLATIKLAVLQSDYVFWLLGLLVIIFGSMVFITVLKQDDFEDSVSRLGMALPVDVMREMNEEQLVDEMVGELIEYH